MFLRRFLICGMLISAAFSPTVAKPMFQQRAPSPVSSAGVQTQADAFTRYDLGDPATESFRIFYSVSATTPGAALFFNQIRPGSEPDVHGVYDRMTGDALPWSLVTGVDARASGLIPNADEKSEFIRVELKRPVPTDGRGRLLIDKTYKDPASYFEKDGVLVFERRLGVKRNAVVLPAGYELLSVNYPSQVIERADQRLELSFINPGVDGVPYKVEARRHTPPASPKNPTTAAPIDNQQRDTGPFIHPERPIARTDFTIPQRAAQTRDIVYFLQDPASHSFRLYHDYEETRSGVDRYLNIVRPGSRATNPSATILDTGEALSVETLRGAEITDREIDIGEPVTADTELVAIWFDPVKDGQSKLLRIEETYTDPNRYFLLTHDEFIWDRRLGRSRNTIVLPTGWRLTNSATPVRVNRRDDGRISLQFIEDSPNAIDTLIKARRNAPSSDRGR